MNKTRKNRALLFVVCMVLIAATALFATGCGNNASETAQPTTVTMENGAVLGEGAKQFTFTVVDGEGNETTATINSDADTVGEALQALKLIDGDIGEYGMYVKTVNGVTVDWDKDGKYWAFYIGDEYAMTSVDLTDITAGATYTFKAE